MSSRPASPGAKHRGRHISRTHDRNVNDTANNLTAQDLSQYPISVDPRHQMRRHHSFHSAQGTSPGEVRPRRDLDWNSIGRARRAAASQVSSRDVQFQQRTTKSSDNQENSHEQDIQTNIQQSLGAHAELASLEMPSDGQTVFANAIGAHHNQAQQNSPTTYGLYVQRFKVCN
jgi:hypothetical protein